MNTEIIQPPAPTPTQNSTPPFVVVDQWVPCSYYVQVTDDSWLNQRGRLTRDFRLRGLWDTAQEAETIRAKYLRRV